MYRRTIQSMRLELDRLFGMRRKCDWTILPLRECDQWLSRDAPWYPEALELQPEDQALLDWLRRELDSLGRAESLSDRELLQFALRELLFALRSPTREDKVLRLRFYLSQNERDLRAAMRSQGSQ